MDNYCVYIYLDTRHPGTFKYGRWKFDHQPIYVGMGRPSRPYDHLKKSHNRILANKINSIRRSGLEPIIQIKKHGLTAEAAYKLEVRLIQKIGRHDLGEGPLVNLTDCSGDGPKRVGAETKIRISRNTKRQMDSLTLAEQVVRRGSISEGLRAAYEAGRRDAMATGAKISKTKKANGSSYNRMSEEERKEFKVVRGKAIRNGWALKALNAPEEIEAFKKKMSDVNRNIHASMSEETKRIRAEKCRQAALRQHARMTEAERIERSERIKNGIRKGK